MYKFKKGKQVGFSEQSKLWRGIAKLSLTCR